MWICNMYIYMHVICIYIYNIRNKWLIMYNEHMFVQK